MNRVGNSDSAGPEFVPVPVLPRTLLPSSPVPFEALLADSATTGELRDEPVRSITANAACTERVAQNLSPLSDPPASVDRAVRESYGRHVSARHRRFDAHA